MDKKEKNYILAQDYHNSDKKVYAGDLQWAVNKKSDKMANVLYEATHFNENYTDERRGEGKNYATWIFSEEDGKREGIFSTNFDFLIDSTFEANATIGLHYHYANEEIYYILEGELEMTTVSAEGAEYTELLKAGDSHMVKLGQGHYGKIGKDGVRFITVGIKSN